MQIFKLKDGRSKSHRERGQILVEFAIVATVFFLFLFGIFDFARMFQSWITVQHSAREAARYAITGLAACDGIAADRDACIVQKAESGTLGLPDGGIGSSLVTVNVKYWDYITGGTYAVNSTTGDGGPCDVIEVEVVYQHSFLTPLVKPVMSAIGADPISLKGTQRMTNEPWGACVSSLPPAAPPSNGGGGGGPAPPGATATNTAVPTATSPPPTATSPPPTATSPPPTATSPPPTATSPPTATATSPPEPTATPIPDNCFVFWGQLFCW